MMGLYKKLIQHTFIAFLIGALLVLWGYKNDGIFRIGFGLLIIIVFLKDGIKDLYYIQELRSWMKRNNGRLVFFYATKSDVQLKIEQRILPFIPGDAFKVFYMGPMLEGDMKLSLIISLMTHFKEVTINSPSIFKITGYTIRLQEIPELMTLTDVTELSPIRKKIDQIIHS